MFDNYMLVIAATGDSWPEARKRAVLLHALGTEGQRIFYSLPNTGTTYKSALEALNKHFVPKVNVIAERHKFRQRAQRPDESINEYVAALRELASQCEFRTMEDQMLRDQFIERVANTRIRDRLLIETDLTFEKSIAFAVQIESGLKNASVLLDHSATHANASTPASLTVGAIHRQPQNDREKNKGTFGANAAAATTAIQPRADGRSCYRCGSASHLANDRSCPAVHSTCNACGKVGHFSRVCRSEQQHVRQVVMNDITVLYVTDTAAARDKIVCTVQVDTEGHSHAVQLSVDTGSSVSIIPEPLYRTYFPTCKLLPPTVNLLTYSRDRIPVTGCMEATVTHDGRSTTGTFVVVKSGMALLGLDLVAALHMRIEGAKVITTLPGGSPAASPTSPVASPTPPAAATHPPASPERQLLLPATEDADLEPHIVATVFQDCLPACSPTMPESTAACNPCQYNDKTVRTATAPHTPAELPAGPWEKVAIAITGPFEHVPSQIAR